MSHLATSAGVNEMAARLWAAAGPATRTAAATKAAASGMFFIYPPAL
jgi:hypothetical protein